MVDSVSSSSAGWERHDLRPARRPREVPDRYDGRARRARPRSACSVTIGAWSPCPDGSRAFTSPAALRPGNAERAGGSFPPGPVGPALRPVGARVDAHARPRSLLPGTGRASSTGRLRPGGVLPRSSSVSRMKVQPARLVVGRVFGPAPGCTDPARPRRPGKPVLPAVPVRGAARRWSGPPRWRRCRPGSSSPAARAPRPAEPRVHYLQDVPDDPIRAVPGLGPEPQSGE
jgi:hypothetical protein